MKPPEDLVAEIQKEHFIAVKEMLDCAQAQACTTEQEYVATKHFLVILTEYYKELKTVLQAIQSAGAVLKEKLEQYNQPPKLESLGDL